MPETTRPEPAVEEDPAKLRMQVAGLRQEQEDIMKEMVAKAGELDRTMALLNLERKRSSILQGIVADLQNSVSLSGSLILARNVELQGILTDEVGMLSPAEIERRYPDVARALRARQPSK